MPVKFQWAEACKKVLDTLKAKLAKASVLMAQDFSQSFILQTDASEFGLGAMLLQQAPDSNSLPVPSSITSSCPEREIAL